MKIAGRFLLNLFSMLVVTPAIALALLYRGAAWLVRLLYAQVWNRGLLVWEALLNNPTTTIPSAGGTGAPER